MATHDSTPPDDDDNDFGASDFKTFNQEEADKYQAQADIDAQVSDDVRHNSRYDDFFADYQPAVRADFARHYVMMRERWLHDGQDSERRHPRSYDLNLRAAYAGLWAIQHKKVFDLQCRWRAEQVRDVPGVLICDDFASLSLGIENCAAVPPISEDELAVYLDWLRQADYERDLNDPYDQRWDWQNYRAIREALAPEAPPAGSRAKPKSATKSLPLSWYRFSNERSGHDALLHLPDVRGHKEERYWDAWRAAEAERAAIQAAAGDAPDPRPRYLPLAELRELGRQFAQRFEPGKVNRWRELSELLNPYQTEEDRKFRLVLSWLQMQKEPVPVPAGADWRAATWQAFYAHSHQKQLEYLPQVYAEYGQNLELGLPQPCRVDFDPLEYDTSKYYRGWLLDGRARLGEPEDFEF
jgi:hypothetical protein